MFSIVLVLKRPKKILIVSKKLVRCDEYGQTKIKSMQVQSKLKDVISLLHVIRDKSGKQKQDLEPS